MEQETQERAAQNVGAEGQAGAPVNPQGNAPADPQAGAPVNPQGNAATPPPPKPTRISSPEQVDDYIHVTTPGMWLLVVAMVILLAALIIWGYAARIEVKTTDQNGQVTTEYVAPASFLTDGTMGN